MGLHIKELKIDGHERVIEVTDHQRGLHAFIAIHNTTMGPGVGGTRILPYPNREEALTDVLRLSKGMTYKSVLANTKAGGSKSTLIIDPKKGKTKEMLEAYGEAVNYLQGTHYCAEDMNCSEADLRIIQTKTNYCLGLPEHGGDPSRFTAWGVFKSIQATALRLWGSTSLLGKKIAIQGIGGVGGKLMSLLFWEGAELIVADIDPLVLEKAASDYSARVVSTEEILEVECDIFSPCARGGILNKASIDKLRCKAIVGAANNQLLEEYEDSLRIHQRGILYAPDYVANAGGIISVVGALDPQGVSSKRTLTQVNQIYDRVLEIFTLSETNQITTGEAANKLVEKILYEENLLKNAMV